MQIMNPITIICLEDFVPTGYRVWRVDYALNHDITVGAIAISFLM